MGKICNAPLLQTRQGRGVCNRKTNKGPMCWQHGSVFHNLRVKKSKVVPSESGLYPAKTSIKPGNVIDKFKGDKFKSEKEFQQSLRGLTKKGKRQHEKYTVSNKSKTLIVDHTNENSCYARFANEANKKSDENAELVELTAKHKPSQLAIEAEKKIKPNQEILVGYGPNYDRSDYKKAKEKVPFSSSTTLSDEDRETIRKVIKDRFPSVDMSSSTKTTKPSDPSKPLKPLNIEKSAPLFNFQKKRIREILKESYPGLNTVKTPPKPPTSSSSEPIDITHLVRKKNPPPPPPPSPPSSPPRAPSPPPSASNATKPRRSLARPGKSNAMSNIAYKEWLANIGNNTVYETPLAKSWKGKGIERSLSSKKPKKQHPKAQELRNAGLIVIDKKDLHKYLKEDIYKDKETGKTYLKNMLYYSITGEKQPGASEIVKRKNKHH